MGENGGIDILYIAIIVYTERSMRPRLLFAFTAIIAKINFFFQVIIKYTWW